ncbi:hypothetical protein LJC74_03540 [Eubacteriales bacterium OttesenSCG-928-A19]|nr:hypothetical protein [Eubacteriales bacterium OttesenSCG-928-A19]
MEARVKEMFHCRRQYEGERNIIAACMNDYVTSQKSEKEQRLKYLNKRISILDGWLMLLTEDEAFVVKRHLIDGIDWPRVTQEFERLWGREFARAERTLRSYQQNAMNKIIRFIADHTEMLQ